MAIVSRQLIRTAMRDFNRRALFSAVSARSRLYCERLNSVFLTNQADMRNMRENVHLNLFGLCGLGQALCRFL